MKSRRSSAPRSPDQVPSTTSVPLPKLFLEKLHRSLQTDCVNEGDFARLTRNAPPLEDWWTAAVDYALANPPRELGDVASRGSKKLACRGFAWLDAGHLIAKTLQQCRTLVLPDDKLEMAFYFNGIHFKPDGILARLARTFLYRDQPTAAEAEGGNEDERQRLLRRIGRIRDNARQILGEDPFHQAVAKIDSGLPIRTKLGYQAALSKFKKLDRALPPQTYKCSVAEDLNEKCRGIEEWLKTDSASAEVLSALNDVLDIGRGMQKLGLLADEQGMTLRFKAVKMTGKGSSPLREQIDATLANLRPKGKPLTTKAVLASLGAKKIAEFSGGTFYEISGVTYPQLKFEEVLRNAKAALRKSGRL